MTGIRKAEADLLKAVTSLREALALRARYLDQFGIGEFPSVAELRVSEALNGLLFAGETLRKERERLDALRAKRKAVQS